MDMEKKIEIYNILRNIKRFGFQMEDKHLVEMGNSIINKLTPSTEQSKMQPKVQGWKDIADSPKESGRYMLWTGQIAIAGTFYAPSRKWTHFHPEPIIITHWIAEPSQKDKPISRGINEEVSNNIC